MSMLTTSLNFSIKKSGGFADYNSAQTNLSELKVWIKECITKLFFPLDPVYLFYVCVA